MFLLVRSYAYNELVETVISSYLTRKKEKEVLRCEGEIQSQGFKRDFADKARCKERKHPPLSIITK